MTPTRRDLRKLALPLVCAVGLSAGGLLVGWMTHDEARRAAAERNQAAAAKTRIETRLRQFDGEEADLKERQALFLQLKQTGIVGEEKRLDWMEQLLRTQRALHLPGIQYEFGPRAPFDKQPSATAQWFVSPLRLKLRLLHERDLLDFLARTEREAKAFVIVRSCKLAAPAAVEGAAIPLIEADCAMDWLTAPDPGGEH